MDLVAELAQYLRDNGYDKVYEDWSPDSKLATGSTDAIVVFGYSSAAPFGRTGFNVGVVSENLQIRVRRATRAQAHAELTQLVNFLCRDANEKWLELPGGNVQLNLRDAIAKLDDTGDSVTMRANLIAAVTTKDD